MGFDASARIGVGFKVDFLQKSIVTGSVTKYDPDTGKPIQKDEVKKVMTAIIDGKEVERADDWEYTNRMGQVGGLPVYESGYEEGTTWAGKVVIAATSIGDGGEDYQEFAPTIPDNVREFGEKHGIQPKWILDTNG